MPKTETVYDEFMPWPYVKPYGMVEIKIVKPKKPRKPRRRSSILADLRTPKYKPRVVPNKKRVTPRGKVGVELEA